MLQKQHKSNQYRVIHYKNANDITVAIQKENVIKQITT